MEKNVKHSLITNQRHYDYHYYSRSYDTKGRFCSYWHQIDEIASLMDGNILYIGVGNGFVPKYLRDRLTEILVLDNDENLKPDIVGSVVDIPFGDGTFSVVACCEVLEHLPYEYFDRALSEIYRVTNGYAIISLPDVTTVYRIDLELPRIKNRIQKLIEHPFHRPAINEYNGEHYWEIGKKFYPVEKIISAIKQTNFKLEKSYRVFEYYYHRFFILKHIGNNQK